MPNSLSFFVFSLLLPWIFPLKIDEKFQIEEASYITNWIELGSAQYFADRIRLIPDSPERISLIRAGNTIKYDEAFTIDLSLSMSKSNAGLNFGDGLALWLLREDLGYTQVNYTHKTAGLFGSSGVYKGLGIFLVLNQSEKGTHKVIGKENNKVFAFQKESLLRNSRSCDVELANNSLEMRINYEDFLFVYVKNSKSKRFELCFSLAENYEIPSKEFVLMISAQTMKTTGFVGEINFLTVSSDVVNSELMANSSETNPKNDTEFDNLPALQEKIKSILLIQVEQIKKLEHIKRYNSLSLKDMKNDIKDIEFFHKLVGFEMDIQVMSEVLQQQREKINNILQTFENFGNHTQTTISNSEQIKKKDAERIAYFEGFLSEFDKTLGSMENLLRRTTQERENVISKTNSILKSQRSIQENKDILLNSLSNNVEVTKFLLENDKRELNWTNYVSLCGLFGIVILSVLLFLKFVGRNKEHIV